MKSCTTSQLEVFIYWTLLKRFIHISTKWKLQLAKKNLWKE